MKKLLIGTGLLLLIILSNSQKSFASSWSYPMTGIDKRATLKGFGVLANDAFYKNHNPALFPTHFYGYHAGQDLETFENEKSNDSLVPFYAVSDGTIIYIGSLSGYGGVILEKLSDNEHVALYGHVKLPSGIQVGATIQAGQLISYLGNNFSGETSGERKHLHFALHIGTDQYFHGHEQSLEILHTEWEDPIPFLKSHYASLPGQAPTPTPLTQHISTISKPAAKTQNIFRTILSLLVNLLKKL